LGSLDCVFQVLEKESVVGHRALSLQAGSPDVKDGQEKAFAQVDCPYCNIRLVGLGQDGL
jgi:hypothetical protein